MSSSLLTAGAIVAILEGAQGVGNPVLQVTEMSLVATGQNTAERYRMTLSDGAHTSKAMLATPLNDKLRTDGLQTGSIIRLNDFVCNTIQNRRIIIVLKLDVLHGKSHIFGDPKKYELTGSQVLGTVPAQPSTNQPYRVSGFDSPAGRNAAIPLYSKAESITSSSSYGGLYAGGSLSGVNSNAYQRLEEFGGGFMDQKSNNGYQNQRFPNVITSSGYGSSVNAVGRTSQSTYMQSLSHSYTNRGPISKNEAPARIIPIAALNPYQGRWTIKARVTTKGEMRRFSNPRGEGRVFSFDLLDAEGGEIRATCFNSVADQFYDLIEVGKVYLISRGSLKPSQKSFNHLNNDYEITLESTSTVQLCVEEDSTIPRQNFNFRPIGDIEGMENNAMVDLIGVVTSVSPSATIMRKNGTETHKRTLQFKDMSGRSVELTLWGNICENEGAKIQAKCDSGVFPVLGIKAGRVSDFSGKSVGTISSSLLFIDPDFPEAQRIREWYQRDGKSSASVSISRDTSIAARSDIRKTVSQIKDEGLGRSEKPDWIAIKGTVTYIKVDNFSYTACPLMVGDRPCNKKVNNNGDGTWRCDRCDQNFPQCDYRYLLQIQIQDHTGITWVTAFQQCGEEIMGLPAKDLYLMKYEEQDEVRFAEVLRRVYFNEYLFKLKIKEENFSDEQRVKSTIVKADKVGPASECRYLLGLISAPRAVPCSYVGRTSGSSFSPMSSNNLSNPLVNQAGCGDAGNRGFGEGVAGAKLFCSACGSSGHNFQNCPRNTNTTALPGSGGASNRYPASDGGSGNGSDACYKCQQPGHWARDCPGPNAGLHSSTTYGGGSNMSGRYTRPHVGGF